MTSLVPDLSIYLRANNMSTKSKIYQPSVFPLILSLPKVNLRNIEEREGEGIGDYVQETGKENNIWNVNKEILNKKK